jgi:hypothetical protein
MALRWEGHEERMEEIRKAYRYFVGKSAREYLEELNVDEVILISWISEKEDGVMLSVLIYLRICNCGCLL